jgi:hypothetical protein
MNETVLRQHIEELLALNNTSAARHNSTGSRVAMAKKEP